MQNNRSVHIFGASQQNQPSPGCKLKRKISILSNRYGVLREPCGLGTGLARRQGSVCCTSALLRPIEHIEGFQTVNRTKQKLVVIGNGMAPGRVLEKLFEAAPDAYEVTIFNAEPRVNYDRIMLSPVLSGEKSFDQIIIHGDGWYVKHGVTLYKGVTITAIDTKAKNVTSARGQTVSYDKLVIATGSQPVIIPVPGHRLAG